jgi:hypothetical protein
LPAKRVADESIFDKIMAALALVFVALRVWRFVAEREIRVCLILTGEAMTEALVAIPSGRAFP